MLPAKSVLQTSPRKEPARTLGELIKLNKSLMTSQRVEGDDDQLQAKLAELMKQNKVWWMGLSHCVSVMWRAHVSRVVHLYSN